MAMEIERKFKLKTPDLLDGLTGSYFLQGYLAKGSVLVRVRVAAETAWLTLKGQALSSMSRPEWEYEIPVADAMEMARQPGVYALEKTRYLIAQNGHTFEVDRYHGALEGLYSVEVEMNSENTQVTLPDWVGEEVTGNKAWDNESLARLGCPEGAII
jgi:CYTH domain-containing protein